jgi:hypothetical protein
MIGTNLELHASFRSQSLQHLGVTRGKAPSAEQGVRDQETVERIARPAHFERSLEPAHRRRFIENPPVVLDESSADTSDRSLIRPDSTRNWISSRLAGEA